jgi:hypothetical protein
MLTRYDRGPRRRKWHLPWLNVYQYSIIALAEADGIPHAMAPGPGRDSASPSGAGRSQAVTHHLEKKSQPDWAFTTPPGCEPIQCNSHRYKELRPPSPLVKPLRGVVNAWWIRGEWLGEGWQLPRGLTGREPPSLGARSVAQDRTKRLGGSSPEPWRQAPATSAPVCSTRPSIRRRPCRVRPR